MDSSILIRITVFVTAAIISEIDGGSEFEVDVPLRVFVFNLTWFVSLYVYIPLFSYKIQSSST